MNERPTIESIDDWIARLENRQVDWEVLKFQAEVDPKYRRAQIRYLGGGGTGKHDDQNIVPAHNFTLSTMLLPPASEGPLHLHSDVEEVFFVLTGRITCVWVQNGEKTERTLGPKDMICTPPGVYRGVRNEGDVEATMLVMLGEGRPLRPSYPEGSPLKQALKKQS